MSERYKRSAVRQLTIISDLLLINAGFLFAYAARYEFQWLLPTSVVVPYEEYVGQQALLTLLLTVTFVQNRVWRRRRGEGWLDEVSRVGYATATGIALMMAFTFFFRPLAFSRLLLVWALIFIVLFIALARLGRQIILDMLYRRGIGVDRAVVVGSGEVARSVIRTLLARPDLGFKAIGYLDDGSTSNNIGSGRIPHLGDWRQLPQLLVREAAVDTVFIALPSRLQPQIEFLIRACQEEGAQARVVPDLFQLSLNRVEFNNMAGIPMLNARDVRISPVGQALKRLMDLTVVLLLAVPAGLVTIITAVAVRLESSGPAFFVQERVGYRGKTFKMAKFRSMVVGADEQKAELMAYNEASGPIFKIRNDPRVTRVGRFIRRFSLDELPQLYNVLKGEMSLVGPRPPLAEEVEQYQPWHRQRLEVKGGITGLWQVSGRSDLTFDEQCLLDIYYIENWSLALDLRILLQTIPYILFGRGAY
ncbi:MAG: sugar transferase [Candidatus Promineifilaceae bacterium]|nr:sugar transferase [Candidatus Promineifilaceae bacterium]